MDKATEGKNQDIRQAVPFKSHFKAIDPNSNVISCDNCTYGQQDIDTYPCAKCHTRH